MGEGIQTSRFSSGCHSKCLGERGVRSCREVREDRQRAMEGPDRKATGGGESAGEEGNGRRREEAARK